jgi:hypothetical protein
MAAPMNAPMNALKISSIPFKYTIAGRVYSRHEKAVTGDPKRRRLLVAVRD